MSKSDTRLLLWNMEMQIFTSYSDLLPGKMCVVGGPGSMPPYQSDSSTSQGPQASPYPHAQEAGPQAFVPPPMPIQNQPVPPEFRPTGRKRALLVGCNYAYAPHPQILLFGSLVRFALFSHFSGIIRCVSVKLCTC